MALHPDFPGSPHAPLDLEVRWFPTDEALRESSAEKLMPPLVPVLRKKVKDKYDLFSRKGWSLSARPWAKAPSRKPRLFWLNLQKNYELWQAEHVSNEWKLIKPFSSQLLHAS